MVDPLCAYCDEPVLGSQALTASHLAHRECGIRDVVGGIGHLMCHEHWCVRMRDPDAGRSYRASALLVASWVSEYGLGAALALNTA